MGKRIALRAMAHLSDDETVAKMGHPNLDVGHPAESLRIVNRRCVGCIIELVVHGDGRLRLEKEERTEQK
jgi:hypothetical protein